MADMVRFDTPMATQSRCTLFVSWVCADVYCTAACPARRGSSLGISVFRDLHCTVNSVWRERLAPTAFGTSAASRLHGCGALVPSLQPSQDCLCEAVLHRTRLRQARDGPM